MKEMLRTASVALGTVALGLMSVAGAATNASAAELWDPHLRGVNSGLAAGALPPPGVYGVINNYLADYNSYDAKGKKKPNGGLTALVEVPIVLWTPGIKILGADYGVAIAQPFDYTNYSPLKASSTTGAGNWGTFNTVIVPAILSWSLPSNFHVSTALNIYVDDASSTMRDLQRKKLNNSGLPSGNNFWTFEPSLGISWLSNGWNVSIDSHLALNTTDNKTKYHTGAQIAVDYTVTKTLGKWTFGLGGHSLNQIQDDSGTGAAGCKGNKGCRVESYGVGPLVGFQFGGINLMAQWDHNLYTQNDVAGDIYNIRAVIPF